jgi:hypothetical protein
MLRLPLSGKQTGTGQGRFTALEVNKTFHQDRWKQQRFKGVPSNTGNNSYTNLLGTVMDYERSINLNNEIEVHFCKSSSYTV